MPAARSTPEARQLVTPDGFFTPAEAANFLRIHRKWVYQLVAGGALSHLRHGRRISIPKTAVYEYAAHLLRRGYVA